MGIAGTANGALSGAPRSGLLPIEASTFIGRRREVRHLVKLQAGARVLTLVGPGGSGKTRLAIRVARQLQAEMPGGVWFFDMVQESRGFNALEVAADVLADVPGAALLVIDTCETAILRSAKVVERLLANYPRVQILATSREPLGVRDEVTWRIPLLRVPDEPTSGLHGWRAIDSCQLFMSRALAAVPDEGVEGEYSRAIARICRDLDGLPLAIELAALHPGVLGIAALGERTTTPLILSLPGRRDAPARHRSLRALLDWSYARLDAHEQHVLRRVAVFGGDWTVEMATLVCPELAPELVSGAIASLQNKSLVHTSRRSPSSRLELLEITRQYGRALLRDAGEWHQVGRRHLEWCISLAESEAPQTLSQQQGQRLEREAAEISTALEFARDARETELGLRLTTAAFPLWYLHGKFSEGHDHARHFLDQPLQAVKRQVIDRARAWQTQLIIQRGEYAEAESELQELLTKQSESAGEPGLLLMLLGNVTLWSGQLDRAAQLYVRAEQLLASAKNPGMYMAIAQSARVAWERGDLALARSHAQRLLQLPRAGRSALMSRANQIEALLHADEGDASGARRHLQEAERRLRRMDDVVGFVDLLTDRARVLVQVGQNALALETFVNAGGLARSVGARIRLVRAAIEGIACLIAESQPGLSVLLAASASASRAAMRATAWPRDAAQLATALALARRHATRWPDGAATGLGSATYAQAWQLGGLLLESDAASMALGTLATEPPLAIADIPPSLTGREWEVAQLFATGASTRQIADRLTLSRDTVRTHLDRATAKLGLHSRVQLAMWVARSRVPNAV